MKLTFIDKDFKKHSSFEIAPENQGRWNDKKLMKQDILRVINKAISVLKENGILEEDIRVIDWNGQRLFHLKDFDIEKL